MILKNAKVFIEKKFTDVQIYIKDGKISEITNKCNFTDEDFIDCTNKYIIGDQNDYKKYKHFHKRRIYKN